MENWMVSPHYDMQSLGQGKVGPVDVFADAIQGWILDYAGRLADLKEDGAGMAVMVLVAAYPETIECYLTGEDSKNRSKPFFMNGMRRIFPKLAAVPNAALDSVCDDLRNGLYHGSMLKGSVVLIPDGAPITYFAEERVFRINPFAFLKVVQEHFTAYVGRLRAGGTTDEEVANFNRYWQTRHGQTGHVEPPRTTSGEVRSVVREREIVTSTAAPIDPKRWIREL